MEVLKVLEDTLVPNIEKIISGGEKSEGNTPPPEALVFYLKMAGDYYRYLSEIVVKEGDLQRSMLMSLILQQAS